MDDTCRHTLLKLARQTIRCHLAGESLPPLPQIEPPIPCGGVFVTLRNRGRLRGCIGQFRSDTDLPAAVQSNAVSVLSDPRFVRSPVTLQELPQLTIEISVLSQMERAPDPAQLIPGVHGILIRRGGASGCFLPEVCTDMQWSVPEFLSRCCADKAGLDPDAWRDPGTEVYVFTSEHFGESGVCP